MSRSPLPNHPFKVVFHVVVLLVGVFIIVNSSLAGQWLVVGFGALIVVAAVGGLVLIHRDKNPWWFEGPLDRRRAGRRR